MRLKGGFVSIMILVCLYLNAQQQKQGVVNLSVGGGFSYNASLQTQGFHVKGIVSFGDRLMIASYYDNFQSSYLVVEEYLGLQIDYAILSTRFFRNYLGLGCEYNTWQNYTKYDGPYSQQNTLIFYPKAGIEFRWNAFKYYADILYNVTWKEPRLQTGLAIEFTRFFNKKDKRDTYPFFGNKKAKHPFLKRVG